MFGINQRHSVFSHEKAQKAQKEKAWVLLFCASCAFSWLGPVVCRGKVGGEGVDEFDRLDADADHLADEADDELLVIISVGIAGDPVALVGGPSDCMARNINTFTIVVDQKVDTLASAAETDVPMQDAADGVRRSEESAEVLPNRVERKKNGKLR